VIRQHGPTGEPPYRRGGSSYSHARLWNRPTNGFAASIVAPLTAFVSRSNTPVFTVRAFSEYPQQNLDIQVEFRRQRAYQVSSIPPNPPLPSDPWLPVPTYDFLIEDVQPGSVRSFQAPEPLKNFTWWYRVRAGRASLNIWSDWSPQRYIDILPPIGFTTSYVDMNVGVINERTPRATAYVEMNVGIDYPDEPLQIAYTEMNVGVPKQWRELSAYFDMNVFPKIERTRRQAFYADMNVVDGRPTPQIWWIRPQQGREGYVFNIYGQGFGDFQGEFDGIVKLGNYVCQVSRWETVPEDVTVEEHLIKHGLNAADDVITPEHGWIVAIVPDGAVSANVNVILRSE
jgi:hypothetical protein